MMVNFDATGRLVPPWQSPVELRKLPREVQEQILANSAELAGAETRGGNRGGTIFEKSFWPISFVQRLDYWDELSRRLDRRKSHRTAEPGKVLKSRPERSFNAFNCPAIPQKTQALTAADPKNTHRFVRRPTERKARHVIIAAILCPNATTVSAALTPK
jgi:hypothetical protein